MFQTRSICLIPECNSKGHIDSLEQRLCKHHRNPEKYPFPEEKIQTPMKRKIRSTLSGKDVKTYKRKVDKSLFVPSGHSSRQMSFRDVPIQQVNHSFIYRSDIFPLMLRSFSSPRKHRIKTVELKCKMQQCGRRFAVVDKADEYCEKHLGRSSIQVGEFIIVEL